MRTSQKVVNNSLKKQIDQMFLQVICDIKDVSEAQVFCKDFFNASEIEVFSKRLAIAYWLKKGRSYNNIKDNLKVSSATIATVQELVNKPGFKLALKKAEAEEWANVWAEKIKNIVRK